jgi:hypothetical protein
MEWRSHKKLLGGEGVTYLQDSVSERPRKNRSYHTRLQKTVMQPETRAGSYRVYENEHNGSAVPLCTALFTFCVFKDLNHVLHIVADGSNLHC